MIKQVYAFKSHLEETFFEGKRLPVTCFFVPEHLPTEIKNQIKSGSAQLFALGKKKPSTKKNLIGILKKLNLKNTPRFLKEIAIDGKEVTSQVVDMSKILSAGQLVQVSAVSKGKGFSGVIKRWNFSTQPRTHGQSDRHRASGSIGRGTTPGRVLKGKKMAGRHGGITKTVKNLRIVDFNSENNLLKVAGLTPGAKNTLTQITIVK